MSSNSAPKQLLTKFVVSPLTGPSPYIKPYCVDFVLDGVNRKWHCMRNHDAVVIIVYNTDRKALVLVRQFRPATYLQRCLETNGGNLESLMSVETAPPLPAEAGDVLEACAGIVDKPDKSLAEIAAEEVLEECGYRVEPDKLELVGCCRSGVGVSSAKQTIYYAEVSDSVRISEGGGNAAEGERIEVVHWPVDQIDELLLGNGGGTSGSCNEIYIGLQFCLLWFKVNKMQSS
ncbi:hypothetical protein BOX15_Mlig034078g1 [Macrostomum lignano]|uniref:Uridine diphosphate glucose pyrophosphatase NUDT14 n=1 Tax=Macrostomum lignano TaxID=282301 RepID=A0A267F262_9PLAT|nr:hypothetical protein BOX15_Mlig034078g1 [Macrostomum lignano]